jgi:S-layer protein
MAIATTAQLSQITAIYTTLFNRAPDTAGLSFWGNALANGASLSTITQGFLSAPEGAAQYPAFLSAEAFVTAFYTKVFGRGPDAGGLAFWTAALNNQGGVESATAKASLVQQIINVVSTPLSAADAALPANAQTVADRALFANKVEFGLYNATAFAVSVSDAATALNNITADPASVVTAKANVFATAIAGTANVVGTAADDTFNVTATEYNAGTNRTFDGAAGNDTLNLSAAGAATITGGKALNIETVNLTGANNINTGTVAADTLFASATTIGLNGANGTATVTGLAGKTLGLAGTTTGTITAAFGDTATTAAIKLSNTTASTATVALTGALLASASVTGTGVLNLASGPATLKTVNVTATNGTITLDADAVTGLTLIDASSTTATGAVNAEVGAGAAYTGGAGVDTVTIAAAPTKLLNGGAGTSDVLVINAATDILAASAANVTGFETLGLGAAADTGSFSAGAFQHITLNTALAGGATFTNVAAGTDLTIGVNTGNITYTLANATGTTDSLALKLTSAGAITTGVTAAGVETINITTTDTDATAHVNALTLVATGATSVVVTGNTGLTLTNTGNVKITNFDASGVTAGAVTFASANSTVGAAVSIKGGAGADILTGSVANDTIVGGAGADQIAGGTGLDVLTGGAGNDIFTISANANSSIFTTITDFTKGDTINLAGFTQGTVVDVAAGSLVNAGLAAGTFAQFLNAAAAGNGGTNALVTYFQNAGDTYIVVDNSAGATFVDGADQVIKLTGLVDLTKGVLTAEVLSLA